MKKLLIIALLVVGCGIFEEEDCAGVTGGDAIEDCAGECNGDAIWGCDSFCVTYGFLQLGYSQGDHYCETSFSCETSPEGIDFNCDGGDCGEWDAEVNACIVPCDQDCNGVLGDCIDCDGNCYSVGGINSAGFL